MARSMQARIEVVRWTVISSDAFDVVTGRIEAAIAHPYTPAFFNAIAILKTPAEVEALVREVAGDSKLIEMARFDLGGVLRKEKGLAGC
jgi:hypothetical protein